MSDLARRRLNRAVEDAKTLLAGDRYLDGIEILGPGEENPEARDAVLILQESRKAIERAEAAEHRRLYSE